MSGQSGDREQIRRAAEMVVCGSDEGDIQYLAAYCLALLDYSDKVPALVEAVRDACDYLAYDEADAAEVLLVAALDEWDTA